MRETPRTWPENAWPTPDQLADWLEICTREERVDFAERAIAEAELASTCRVIHGRSR